MKQNTIDGQSHEVTPENFGKNNNVLTILSLLKLKFDSLPTSFSADLATGEY